MSSAEPFDPDSLLSLLDGLYPRFMGQIDRDPDSPTYGSCDRGFWMYRLHDFDSGVVQQASLALAALHALAEHTDFAGCRYLDRKQAPYWKELAEAVNRRNVAVMDKRGLLDEYYPGERSFPASVFASYATLKSAAMLGQQTIVEHGRLDATARDFAQREPSPAGNQDSAAAAFLALRVALGRDPSGEAQAAARRLVERKRFAGRFLEYGGADLGYLTVTLNYLGYLHADGGIDVSGPLVETARFIADFITPSGHLGGEYASRSTTYALPFGVLAAARCDPALAARLAPLDVADVFARFDDRYLMHYSLASLAMTVLDLHRQGRPEVAPTETSGEWSIRNDEAVGLLLARRGRSFLAAAPHKGGSLQVDGPEGVVVDCGYRIERDGATYATCVLDDGAETRFEEQPGAIELSVDARFLRYKELVASPLKTIVLRLLGLLGPWLNAYFKRVLIQDAQVLDGVRLRRKVRLDLERGELTVADDVEGMSAGDRLSIAPAASLRLVPSAKFHQAGEAEAHVARGESGAPSMPRRRRFRLPA